MRTCMVLDAALTWAPATDGIGLQHCSKPLAAALDQHVSEISPAHAACAVGQLDRSRSHCDDNEEAQHDSD